MTEQKTRKEEFKLDGSELVDKVKEYVHKGSIRRIVIKNPGGKVLIDIPLTVGVLGTVIAPQLAALSAFAALVTRCTVVLEKIEEEPPSD
ncbi:DUF4342 domain-containing protein [Candidatus Fermentibacteria bacterium]|nr:DUF4342 domain-containing protein [Candidatus Fermentibacteria bacterium]